uniref:Putative secreted protein n=1 Tax=Rhipicephalus microplus TaxID=6941 RepID=A0A6G5A3F5_RHIMP
MMNNRFVWVILVPAALAAFVKTPRHTGDRFQQQAAMQPRMCARQGATKWGQPWGCDHWDVSTVQPPLLQSSKAQQQGSIITSASQEQTPNHQMHWHQLCLPADSSTPQRCHLCLYSCGSSCHSV